MNQYEREHVTRIINEIKEIEKKKQMSDVEKAYYLYRSLGDIYEYKVNYVYADGITDNQYIAKIELHREGTTEKGEAICTDMNRTYMEGLSILGIESHLSFTDERNPLSHTDVCFKDREGNYYFANLTSDIMHIKTGMKIRNFGLSEEQLRNKLYHENPEKNRLYHLLRMHEENEGEEFTAVPEAQLKQWDDEAGYTYQGIYTNDVLDRMAGEMLDKEFMSGFFGTNQEDELVQRKIEFVMDRLEIVNVHRKKRIGDVEAMEYYTKILKKILTKEEMENYIEKIYGFTEGKKGRQAKTILVVKKENENIYYLYNSKNQIFERLNKEKLLNQSIKYHCPPTEINDISVAIDSFEKRPHENEREI